LVRRDKALCNELIKYPPFICMQIFAPSVQYVAKHRHVVGQRRQSAFMRWWSGPAGAYLIDHIQRSLLVARSETRRKTRLRKLGWLSEQFARIVQRPNHSYLRFEY
jgi:streptomycin 6-kinase